MGIHSTDIKSYKVQSVNPSDISSWLVVFVKLLKSITADTSSLVTCEKLGSFWLDEDQRGSSLANTVFYGELPSEALDFIGLSM